MNSIRRAIVRSVCAAALGVCAATFVVVFFTTSHPLHTQFDRELMIRARAVAGATRYDRGQLEVELSEATLQESRRKDGAAFFLIVDANGNVLKQSENAKGLVVPPGVTRAEATGFQDIVLPDHRAGRMVAFRTSPEIENDDENAVKTGADVWVVMAADLDPVTRVVRELAAAFLIAFGLIAALLLVILPPLVRVGLRPLDRLAAQASAIDASNLTRKFSTDDVPAEIKPIAEQLNVSLDRLADAFDRERRFAANAAHELRTPLAAIRANAEVALKWPDVDQFKASMTDVQRAAVRMQSLVERLLELSRLGATLDLPRSRVNLVDVVTASVQSVAPTLAARSLRVRTEFEPAVWVSSHADLLPPLVSNVVSNAAKHATAGSEILIFIRNEARTELSIENDTADLTAADLGVMFMPLWTKSSDRSQGGAGLGLALVTGYARALGIELTPTVAAGRFRLVIRFPQDDV